MTTVLVVDDSPVDRCRVGGLLQSRPGWTAMFAADGHEALAAIERPASDLVLMDLRMPGMNGLELVEEIRKRFRTLAIILMTAFGSEDIAPKITRRAFRPLSQTSATAARFDQAVRNGGNNSRSVSSSGNNTLRPGKAQRVELAHVLLRGGQR